MVGNPARKIGWMSRYGQRLHFDQYGKASCSESGEQFSLKDNQVILLDAN